MNQDRLEGICGLLNNGKLIDKGAAYEADISYLIQEINRLQKENDKLKSLESALHSAGYFRNKGAKP